MLVTITTPAYNDQAGLNLTARCIAWQTHRPLYWVIVDDGSEQPLQVPEGLPEDIRVRLIRFHQNHGRGAARQAALEAAQGEFLTMVDAGDWIVPGKIERQVQLMQDYSDVGLTSSAMFMVNERQQLVGIDRFGHSDKGLTFLSKLESPKGVPIPHAPSLLRLELAQRHFYERNLRSSEDFDFLLKFCMENSCLFDPTPQYVYEFTSNKAMGRLREQISCTRQSYSRYFLDAPLTVASQISKLYLKGVFYRGIESVKPLKESYYSQKFPTPTPQELSEFEGHRREFGKF